MDKTKQTKIDTRGIDFTGNKRDAVIQDDLEPERGKIEKKPDGEMGAFDDAEEKPPENLTHQKAKWKTGQPQPKQNNEMEHYSGDPDIHLKCDHRQGSKTCESASGKKKETTSAKKEEVSREKAKDKDKKKEKQEDENQEKREEKWKTRLGFGNDHPQKRLLKLAMKHALEPLKELILPHLEEFQHSKDFEKSQEQLASVSKVPLTELKVEKLYKFLFIDDAKTTAKASGRSAFGNFLRKTSSSLTFVPDALLLLEEMANESMPYIDFMRHYVEAVKLLNHTPLESQHKAILYKSFSTFTPQEIDEFYAAAAKYNERRQKEARKQKEARDKEEAEKMSPAPPRLVEYLMKRGRDPLKKVVLKKIGKYQKSEEFQKDQEKFEGLSKMTLPDELYQFFIIDSILESHFLSFLSEDFELREVMELLEEMASTSMRYQDFMDRFDTIYECLEDLTIKNDDTKALEKCYAKFNPKGCRLSLADAKKAAKELKL